MCKETAKLLREELKSLGFNSKLISVRSESYSMGSTVHVRIKSPIPNLEAVEAVSSMYSKIRRCEISGEILNGGNTYISCGYDDSYEELILDRFSDLKDKLETVEEFERVEVNHGLEISWESSDFHKIYYIGDKQFKSYNKMVLELANTICSIDLIDPRDKEE